jgi:hypothetical protein
MNPKKISISLRLLANDINDYFRGSGFGVPAMDPDVLRLWTDYNNFLDELRNYDDSLTDGLHEIPYPAPYLAEEDSFYKEGTMIYKPEHFVPLKQAVQKLLDAIVPLVWNRESA